MARTSADMHPSVVIVFSGKRKSGKNFLTDLLQKTRHVKLTYYPLLICFIYLLHSMHGELFSFLALTFNTNPDFHKSRRECIRVAARIVESVYSTAALSEHRSALSV